METIFEIILRYDTLIFRAINNLSNPVLDIMALFVSLPGEAGAFWIALSLIILVFGRREYRIYGLLALVAMFVSDLVIAHTIRVIYFRPRPFIGLEDVHQLGPAWRGSSFPAAHADSSFACAFVLGKGLEKAKAFLYIFATLTSLSRIYLGMHYPSDVIAGALIGLFSGFLIIRLYDYYMARRNRY